MEFLNITVILIVVLDPFGNLPLFSSIISRYPSRDQRRILIRESLIALALLLLFLFSGKVLLNFLGLSTSALRVSGGFILLLIALGMIFPSKSVISGATEETDEEPFIVPLAIPLMAGPSVLTYLILLSNQYPSQLAALSGATLLAWGFSSVILLLSPLFMKWLGRKGMRAVERLMGMILIMISIQMLLDGFADYFHLN